MRRGARAEAQLGVARLVAAGGGYDGPLAFRQGKPMRPDVARRSTAWTAPRAPTASRS